MQPGELPPPAPILHPHALPVGRVAAVLAVDPAVGLSQQAIEERTKRFGLNLLTMRYPVSDLQLLVRQFASPVVALLAAAMGLSLFFGEYQQAAAIAAVLMINTAIGYYTERRAVRSMEALRQLGGRSARVRREGRAQQIPASQLVPGDVVLFDAGDVVSADMRCFSSAAVCADESPLTGESLPVEKGTEPNPETAELHDRSAMLFKGTYVVRGSGEGIVTGTGLTTELGRITKLVEEAESGESPLEKQLALLSRQLVWATLALATAITAIGLSSGRPTVLMVETAIALAVAAIPEGLPIVATLALARGMLRMARHHALVENLAAVETLGSTTLIITDKTGTLTENRMEVERILTPSGDFSVDHRRATILREGLAVDPVSDPELMRALLIGVLCSNADYDRHAGSGTGDPMEVALLRAGSFAGLERQQQINVYPEVAEHPFSAASKRMATVHRHGDRHFAAVKGAPEELLKAADRIGAKEEPLDETKRAAWLAHAERLAAEGLRVLAVAVHPEASKHQPIVDRLIFFGLVAFRDPPRHDIAATIAALRNAGIRVVMATGDHPSTALSISRAVGMTEPGATVMTGAELSSIADSDDVQRRAIVRQQVFARVSPAQKLELIAVFQREGEVVAMTGDGINDAPALMKADIGVAMGQRGTDVAREAADMVLLDDAFPTILHAVREGRVIFNNIRRFATYLLSCNLAEVLVVSLAIFAGLPLPLLPLQILFLNLVTDVFPAFALATGEGEGNVLARPPRPPKEAILSAAQWISIGLFGAAISAATLLSLVVSVMWLGSSATEATTVSFITIALAQLWHVLNMRSRGSGFWRNTVTENRFIWLAVVLCLGLLFAGVNAPFLAGPLAIAPIGKAGWTLAGACSLLPVVVIQSWLSLSRRKAALFQ
ncbi:cation-transporting P-type ATPase [Rhizobium sp. P32RR-XVIII]|uniref:cation-translocating P-type ATPase n=1 Tax=Rhizobium sp. P32RR-XVIII TaxID=2726738 RepID=UPI0014574A8C|nr:cation-transporting P-type ATPase [Rhizobium sp. P32RR-XVIII]NLS07888.1 cation-transporting P-type ATPase [Rhizobium sp. P32RR-XVIII]